MKKQIYESPNCSEFCMRLDALLCVSDLLNYTGDMGSSIEDMGETDFIM
jgi:hypothetical protein